MAGRKKNAVMEPMDETIQRAIAQAVHELYGVHAEEIRTVRDESEKRSVTVAFGAEIDCSESEPTVKVRIRFAATITDVRTTRLDDPNQRSFDFLNAEDEKKRLEEKALAEAGDGGGEEKPKKKAKADKPKKKAKSKAPEEPAPGGDGGQPAA